jgi:hypothetical protein
MANRKLLPKSKAKQAIEFVRREARRCETATDLHNVFFGNGGKFGQLFTTREERTAFFETPEYREIVEIRDSLERPRRAGVTA